MLNQNYSARESIMQMCLIVEGITLMDGRKAAEAKDNLNLNLNFASICTKLYEFERKMWHHHNVMCLHCIWEALLALILNVLRSPNAGASTETNYGKDEIVSNLSKYN